ncbi:MAG: tetratricopeptide repeat protein [candidate division NC10 bacterium]|nr:tetratricopeptide repeat protein [candidate division NC10 bacterium]
MSDRRAVAILLTAVGIAYLNALRGVFQFDDFNVIVHNPAVHSWGAWLHSMPGIRPLLKLSYTLSWTLDRGAAGFLLVNVLCHGTNTLLVYALAVRWAGAQAPRSAAPHAVGLAAALLFALHPANSEAVTYISGRSVSLMATCYLGSLLAYLRGWERESHALTNLASPVLFLAALAVKETAWTLPLALLLWEAGRPGGGWEAGLRRTWLHWAALGLGATAILALPVYRRLLEVSLATRSLTENLLTQIGGQFYLLTRPLLLLWLNIDPDLPVHTAPSAGLILQGTVLAGLVALGLAQLRRRSWFGVGLLWFFLHLLPTNAILPRLDVANDRQLYLAMIGPGFLVAAALVRLPGWYARVAVAALVVVLGGATVLRNHEYRSEVALWEATVKASPGKARAWNNLGYAHQLAGNPELARQGYLRALALQPDHPKARANLEALPPQQAP